MKTLVITGNAGVGKSRLIESLIKSNKFVLVDPLANPPSLWMEPNTCNARGVIIDHAYSLNNANEVIFEIHKWCEQNDLLLIIAEQNLSLIKSKGIELQEGYFELNLVYPNEYDNLEQTENKTSLTLDSGIIFANQFVAFE